MAPDYSKLKTNLNLILHRLKLVEKKKIELNQKARRQIGEFLNTGKIDRARIRVEQIIREDYLIEAMDIIESYCDLILSRFGQLQSSNVIDEGLQTAISSIIWVTPRLESDISELKVISDQLGQKYGKPYIAATRENQLNTVNDVLMKKMSVQAPPKVLVEKYLVEIAKDQKIDYKPDNRILKQQEANDSALSRSHLSSDDDDDMNDSRPPGGGFNLIDLGDHYPAAPITQPFSLYGQPPPLPSDPPQGVDINQAGPSAPSANFPIGFNLNKTDVNDEPSRPPPATITSKPGNSVPNSPHNKGPGVGTSSLPSESNGGKDAPPNYESIISGMSNTSKGPRGGPGGPDGSGGGSSSSSSGGGNTSGVRNTSRVNMSSLGPSNLDDTLPELPPVPLDMPNISNLSYKKDDQDNMDFEDLTRRFEELKNKR